MNYIKLILQNNDYLIKFPSGETQVRFNEWAEYIEIINFGATLDFMHLGMICDCARQINSRVHIGLKLPYIPHARQDRRAVQGDSLAIKVFANLLNSLNLNKVCVVDPHSDVAPALINNCEIKHVWDIIKEVDADTLVAPDIGASKKVQKLAEKLNKNFCQGLKVRDPKTGKLSGFQVLDNPGKHCMIVDDICDGGGTFLGLYDKLKEAGAETIDLYITHGIFTNGIDHLAAKFNKVITTNSFKNNHLNLEIIKVI